MDSWNDIFKDGFSSLLDGAIEKELIKEKNEQIPPAPTQQPITPPAAVKGVFEQNMVVGGVKVNKGLLVSSALILTGIAVYKLVK